MARWSVATARAGVSFWIKLRCSMPGIFPGKTPVPICRRRWWRHSEGRLARLLFKLAVEVDMMMNILAAGMEVSESTLKGLRERCVQEVRQTGGNITFLDAVRYQNEV